MTATAQDVKVTMQAKGRRGSPAALQAARRELLRRRALRTVAAARGVSTSELASGDVDLGRDGSKWRHGWIPLNPVASAIKAKKWKGHGGHEPAPGEIRHAAKTRMNVRAEVSGPTRTKVAPPKREFIPNARTEAAKAINRQAAGYAVPVGPSERQHTSPELHQWIKNGSADMAARARAELDRRKAAKGSPATARAVEVAQNRYRRLEAKRVGQAEAGIPKHVTATRSSRGNVQISDSKHGSMTTVNEGRLASLLGQGHKITGVKGGRVHTVEGGVHRSYGPGLDDGRTEREVTQPERDAAMVDKGGFSKRELLLPGVRDRGGEHILVKPSVKMHNAGHRFESVGGPSPMVEHDQFGVEHGNGAHLGFIRSRDGKLTIGAQGLPEHEVKSPAEAVAGLHAAYVIRARDAEAKKQAEADSARRIKDSQDTARGQRLELEHAARRVVQSQGGRSEKKSEYAASEKLIREAEGSTHEEKRASILAKVRKYGTTDLRRNPLLDTPKQRASVTKNDTPSMQKVRAAQAEALSREAVDLHKTDPTTLKPGQAVSFRAAGPGSNVMETRTGHVVHVGGGIVHVSEPKATYSALYHTHRGKTSADPYLNYNDPSATRNILVHGQNVKAISRNAPSHYRDVHGREVRSYADVVKAADAEFRKRMAAKKAKTG